MTDRIKVLAPGDLHAHPDYDNDRFEWLGKLVVEERPTHVVFPGDTGDYPSICFYDRKKTRAEGRRLAKDHAAVKDAFERFWKPIRKLHALQAAGRRKQYDFEAIHLGGNHDHERLYRLGEDNPEFSGVEAVFQGIVENAGFRYVPYKGTVDIGGFRWSHNFPSGYREAATFAALGKVWPGHSVVSGHIHSLAGCVTGLGLDGRAHHSIFLGEFGHPDYAEEWTRGTEHRRRIGVTVLDGCRGGDFDSYRWTSQARMKELFG